MHYGTIHDSMQSMFKSSTILPQQTRITRRYRTDPAVWCRSKRSVVYFVFTVLHILCYLSAGRLSFALGGQYG